MSSFDDKNLEIPTIVVNLDADIQKQFDAASPKERRKLAYRYIMDNLSGREYIATDGRIFYINSKGADKLTYDCDPIRTRLIPHLEEVFKNAEFVKIKDKDRVRKDKLVKFVYYEFRFEIDGVLYTGLLNICINSNDNKSILYDIKPITEIKKER